MNYKLPKIDIAFYKLNQLCLAFESINENECSLETNNVVYDALKKLQEEMMSNAKNIINSMDEIEFQNEVNHLSYTEEQLKTLITNRYLTNNQKSGQGGQ